VTQGVGPSNARQVKTFRGLFFGVQHFESPWIDPLRYAHRDALAMNALFSEAFGDCTVVVGRDATKARIRSELDQLKLAGTAADLVVVYYSGHGTPASRRLVAYDTDIADLEATTIGMEDFVGSALRCGADNVLVLLDCCFSGLPHVKAVALGYQERNGGAGMATPRIIAGSGQVVITAATADEPAYETDDVQHGQLTYHLIRGLLGSPDTIHDGMISLDRLWGYIGKNLADNTRPLKSPSQTPTFHGQLEGGLWLPQLRRSTAFDEVWDDAPPPPAEPTMRSLLAHGVPEAAVKAMEHTYGTLNTLQIAAINQGHVIAGRTVLVNAPTSTGKTVVGELAMWGAASRKQATVFLMPTRALVMELAAKLVDLYTASCGSQVVRAAGSVNDRTADLANGTFDVAVVTYEKFAALAMRHRTILDRAGTVVVDEIHNLADLSRGAALELLLTGLRSRDDGPQIVGLSAVLGDDDNLQGWLDATPVSSDTRPIPLHLGVVAPDGNLWWTDEAAGSVLTKFEDDGFLPPTHDAAECLESVVTSAVEAGEQVLVFRETVDGAAADAEHLAKVLDLDPAEAALAELDARDDHQALGRLRACLKKGVAFHSSDLADDDRLVVETAFRTQEIKVLVSTTTLAQGVNLPADTVVIRGLNRHDGSYRVSEYLNMAGRAGRVGHGKELGRAIIVADDRQDRARLWEKYVQGVPEPVRSALRTVPEDSLDTLLRACAYVADPRTGTFTEPEVRRFLGRTLAARQYRIATGRLPYTSAEVQNQLDTLVDIGMVNHSAFPKGKLVLAEPGRIAVEHHLKIASVHTLAALFERLESSSLTARNVVSVAQAANELDAIWHTGLPAEDGANYQVRRLRELTVDDRVIDGLRQARDRVLARSRIQRALVSVAWTEGLKRSRIEDLCLSLPRGKAATWRVSGNAIRATTERLADLVPGVLAVAFWARHDLPTRSADEAHLTALQAVLPTQAELGIDAGLAETARFLGNSLHRRQYLDLKAHGLSDKFQIAATDPRRLREIIRGDDGLAQEVVEAANRAIEYATRLEEF